MAAYDGSIRINTSLNTQAFNSGVKGMLSGLKSIAGAVGVAFSIAALVKFGKEAIELSSDLTEVDNVVSKSFGSMRGQMDELANSAVKTLGMSRLTAYQTGSTFMSMGKSMLDDQQAAADMAIELTKLTGNMSSFYNVSQDLASIALKSIYTGETETLKQYGVVMTEVNLKQFALEQGITKSYSAMSQSEKVMLRYQYVMNQLNFIGDDFIDTQDSWANQTRVLSEQWKEFMTVVGNGLVTVLTPVVRALNNVVAALITFANAVGTVLTKVFGLKAQTLSTASAADETAEAYSDASDAVSDYADSASDAAKAAKQGLSSLDDFNNITTTSSSSSSGSGSSGSGSSSGGSITGTDIVAETQDVEVPAWIDGMKNKLGPLTEAMNNFIASLEPLKTFVATGLEDFYNDFLVPLGNWTLGTALPTLIQGLADMNNNIDWPNLNGHLDALWQALEPFAENVGNGLLWFYDNVLIPLATWTIDKVLPEFLDILSGALDVLNKAIEDLKPIWQWLWDNALEPIADWTGGVIVDVLDGIGDALEWISQNEIAVSILEALAIAIGLVAAAIALYNVAMAVAAVVTGAFSAAIAFITSPVGIAIAIITALVAVGILLYKNWDTIKEKASEIWAAIKKTVCDQVERIKTNWNEFIDILKTGKKNIVEGAKSLIEKVKSFFADVKKKISDGLSKAKDAFDTFKEGVEKVFNGIWSTIKKVINSILGGIESMANGVIKGINTIIKALNGLSFDIPDWVPEFGGKKFGFDITELSTVSLPRLANGGITTGSTLANIGEAGREAVLPLEQNTGWMDELATRLADKMQTHVTFEVEGDEANIFKVTQKQAEQYFNRTGNSAFAY